MAPFIANNTAGIDSYKWMLFGDDDTVFYVDNILRMLVTLDHTMPYILSDHIWFPTDLESEALLPFHTAALCACYLQLDVCCQQQLSCWFLTMQHTNMIVMCQGQSLCEAFLRHT